MHVAMYDFVEIKVGVKNKLVWLFFFCVLKKNLRSQVEARATAYY